MAHDAVTETLSDKAYTPTAQQMLNWFPKIDPGMTPFGSRVLVQLKKPRTTSVSGLIQYSDDTIAAMQGNTTVALVRAVGPLAYRKRDTLLEWPEKLWCQPGTLVRVPTHGHNERFYYPDSTQYMVEFRIYDDYQMLGLVTSDPDNLITYV